MRYSASSRPRGPVPARPKSEPARPPVEQLLALQRKVGNRAVNQALARQKKAPVQGPVVPGSVSQPMSLKEFRSEMARFGVKTVTTTEWNPGDPAAIYRSIVDAFADFAARLGGVPSVKNVVFRKGGDGEAAAFIGGRLEVFDIITGESLRKWLPAGRSEQGATYPPVGGSLPKVEGQKGGAPIPAPSRAVTERRIIAHKLGHGVLEGMLTPGVKQADALDKDLLARFEKAVGWFGGQLYDIQDPAVRKAIQQDGRKPAAAPITVTNWNSPKWGEQPMTDYVLTTADEDFSDSLMAYLYAPQLLNARSPARFAFMEKNKAKWTPILAAPAGKKAKKAAR